MALTPYTRQEEWYQQMINASTGNYLPSITAQDEGKVLTVENDGSWGVENVPNELPTVGSSDKNKFLHTNESTGALEWAEGGSGGGVLVVTCTGSGVNIVADKKAGEIYAASKVGIVIWINAFPFLLSEGDERADTLLTAEKLNEGYFFTFGNVVFSAASADDYPTFVE